MKTDSVRSRELKTAYKIVTQSAASLNIGGQVPSAQKRWVTFLQVDTVNPKKISHVAVYFISTATANPSKAMLQSAGMRKFLAQLPGTLAGTGISKSPSRRPFWFPPAGPDPDAPLFSIAGGNYVGIFASVTTADVVMQYFDE
jgi:hypothetical protein